MVEKNHPRSEEITTMKDGLLKRWDELKNLSNDYEQNLNESLLARQVSRKGVFILFFFSL